MRKYLKTLQETLEIVPDGSGGKRIERRGDSMDVQLDRWNLACQKREDRVIVVGHEAHTAVEPSPDSFGSIVNTVSVLYARAREAAAYGVMTLMDPLEWMMYRGIYSSLDDDVLAGRILLLAPSPLAAFTRGADIELSSRERGAADPDTFGDKIYDVIIADRVLSRSSKPQSIVEGAKRALHERGAFLVLEDGFVSPDKVCGYSLEGLCGLLEGFSVRRKAGIGNVLGVVHKIASGGKWIPTPLDRFLDDDPTWPAYLWVWASNEQCV